MKQSINQVKFSKNDPSYIEFYNTHGWVVLQDNLSTSLVENGL